MFNLSDRSKMAAEGVGEQKQPENILESRRHLKAAAPTGRCVHGRHMLSAASEQRRLIKAGGAVISRHAAIFCPLCQSRAALLPVLKGMTIMNACFNPSLLE